jgi:hypothetical protein
MSERLTTDLIVRLVSPNMHPWKVPLRKLARVLNAVQRLVDQRDEEELENEITEETDANAEADSQVLRLLGIRNTSAAYAVAAPDPENAIRVISETGRGIASPGESEWSSATLSSLRELSEVAARLGCDIEFRLPGAGREYGDVIAKITPSTFSMIAHSAFIYGRTSVYGKIERVGGATERHCGIRLPEQPRKMIICQVESADLVRDLGQYIYQYVVISGDATWFRHGWTLKTIKIRSFEAPKKGSIRDALKNVYNAGAKAWDKVGDPAAFLAGIRAE